MKFQLLTICLAFFMFSIQAKPILDNGLAKGLVDDIKGLLFHGIATFFDPASEGGAQGACGPWNNPGSQIVALNTDQYGNENQKSKYCGKKVKICNAEKGFEGKCTTATITDACPTCDYGCLDLTTSVWKKLNSNLNKGIVKIDWHFI